MYDFDLTTIGGFLTSLWALIQGILALDGQAYVAVLTQEGGGRLSFAVLFLAALSITVGQSVVLFANQVRRSRFAISLILSTTLLIAGVLFWSLTVWLLATNLFGSEQSLRNTIIVVSLSYAPLLYGFLVLLPYLGNILYVVLRIWILLNLLLAITAVFNLSLWAALACGLLGWLALEAITRLPVIVNMEAWLWRLIADKRELRTTDEIVDSFVEELRASPDMESEPGEDDLEAET
jgi:hypothetical protein